MSSRRRQGKKRKLLSASTHDDLDHGDSNDGDGPMTSYANMITMDVIAKTSSEVHEVTFKWTIHDYISYLDTNTGDQKPISSPRFSPPTAKNIIFGMDIYPKGDDKECKDYTSLYVFLSSSFQEQHRIQLWVSILKNNGEKYMTRCIIFRRISDLTELI